jgi:hypothetical protein
LHIATCGEPDFDLPGGTIDVAASTFVANDGIGIHARVGRSGTIVVSDTIAVGHAPGENIVTFFEDPVDGEAVAEVRYSNVEGGFAGDGNIDAAPLFVDAPAGDFRLAPGSAGIDAGDNGTIAGWLVTDLAGAPRFVDDPATGDTGLGKAPITDMGAYEFQGGACVADFDGDGRVNLFDFLAFQTAFGNEDPRADLAAPFGVFNLFDFLAFQTAYGNGC